MASDAELTDLDAWRGWARDMRALLGLPMSSGPMGLIDRNELERETRALVQSSPLDRGALLAAVAEVGRKLAEAIHGGSRTVAAAVVERDAQAIEWRLAPSAEADALKAERAANTRLGQELVQMGQELAQAIRQRNEVHANVSALRAEIDALKAATPEPAVRVALTLIVEDARAALAEMPGSNMYVARLAVLRRQCEAAEALLKGGA